MPRYGLLDEEEDKQPDCKIKEKTRHRGSTLIQTPKGTSRWRACDFHHEIYL